MKTLLSLLLFLPLTKEISNADAIVGVWKNSSGKGHIEIFSKQNKFYGKIIWLKNGVDAKGEPKKDIKNVNPDKRNQTLLGLVMLRDFVFKDGEYTNGYIYNPSDGKEYKGQIKLKNNKTLAVRGYIGFSFIGKTDTWTRIR